MQFFINSYIINSMIKMKMDYNYKCPECHTGFGRAKKNKGFWCYKCNKHFKMEECERIGCWDEEFLRKQ